MGIDMGTQNRIMWIGRHFRTFSPKQIFLSNSSHEALVINAEEETERAQESEMVDNFKVWFPYKIEPVVIRIHRDCDRMHKTCINSSQTVYQHLKWEEGLGSMPNQEAICIWYLMTKVESVFCDGVSLGLSNNSNVSIMPKNGWPKMNSLLFIYVFLWIFCLVLFSLPIFVLIVFFVSWVLVVRDRKREHEGG